MEQFDEVNRILKRNDVFNAPDAMAAYVAMQQHAYDASFDMKESNRISVLNLTFNINNIQNKAEKAKELSLLQAAKVEVDRLMADINQEITVAYNAKEASSKSFFSPKSKTAQLTKTWENLKKQQDKLKNLEYRLNQQIPIYEESMKGGRRRGRTRKSSRGRTRKSSRGRTHTSSRRRPKRTVHQ